jgi:hypothetical protein
MLKLPIPHCPAPYRDVAKSSGESSPDIALVRSPLRWNCLALRNNASPPRLDQFIMLAVGLFGVTICAQEKTFSRRRREHSKCLNF